MAVADKIKVLVLGDSGVGKSSLVQLLAHGKPNTNCSWTIGCGIEVKQHEYSEGTPNQRSCFIELWDIGGNRSHILARPVLYQQFHGIILVHDSSNSKSYDNLRKWLGELFYNPEQLNVDPALSSYLAAWLGAPPDEPLDFDMESFLEKDVPVLVAATKTDLPRADSRARSMSVTQECAAEEIQVDCNQAKSIAAGSTNAVKLSRFFDKVIDRRYQSFKHIMADHKKPSLSTASTASSYSMQKFSHLD